MTTQDLWEETYSAVTVNKVRSGLTMLGIVIGIASVIALTAVGAGAQAAVSSSINSLGANLLIITPGASRTFGSTVSAGRGSAETLTPDDATAISTQVNNVEAVAQEVSTREQVVYEGENTNVTILGTTPEYQPVRDLQVADGVFVSDQDVTDGNRIAVIGPTVLQDLFADPTSDASATPDQAIGQTLRIDGQDFTVVGVTVSKGGSGFTNQDNMIFVPLTAAQHYFIGSTSYLTEVDVEASTQASTSKAVASYRTPHYGVT